MTGLRLDVLHALFMSIVPALEIDILRQMRDGENINVFVAVIFPKLCSLHENIFFGVNVKKAGSGKLAFVTVETFNVGDRTCDSLLKRQILYLLS